MTRKNPIVGGSDTQEPVVRKKQYPELKQSIAGLIPV